MVESYNQPRNQVVGRSLLNKTVNFTTAQLASANPPIGSFYLPVRITQTLPNCLVGEAMPLRRRRNPFIPINQTPDFVVLN